jgi:hypothetical protein
MPPPLYRAVVPSLSLAFSDWAWLILPHNHSLRYPLRDYCDRYASHILDRQDSRGRSRGGLFGDLCVRLSRSPLPPNCELNRKRLTYNSSVLNGLAVRWFGTSEFYMSIFKIFLMVGLIVYTFITMVGGNPQHDAYGFRNWKTPVCGFSFQFFSFPSFPHSLLYC